jgi:hypothetical protein
MDVPSILDNIENSLVAEIPAAVGKIFVMEPLYAILIDYFHWAFVPPDFELSTSPPLVIAAPVSVRRRIMDGHDCPDSVQWDAGYIAEEASGSIPLRFPPDGELSVHCSALYQNIDEGDERPGEMLRRAGARLNAVDWHALASITDDFIVCVQDSHGEHDNQQDIEACVPADRIALLQSRDLLWRW